MDFKNLSEQELLELVQDEVFRQRFFKAMSKVLEQKKDEKDKLLTEVASYQTRMFTAIRDVEEVSLLPEAVKKVLPNTEFEIDMAGNKIKLSKEFQETLKKYLRRYGLSLEAFLNLLNEEIKSRIGEVRNDKEVERTPAFGTEKGYLDFLIALKELSLPFDIESGWQWTRKILKNLSLKKGETTYPIDISLPEDIFEEDKKIGELYYVGIKVKVKEGRKTKTVFKPIIPVSVIKSGNIEGFYINGIDITGMSIEELNQFYKTIARKISTLEVKLEKTKRKEKDLTKEEKEKLKEIEKELIELLLMEKLWDKSVFFLKTISSSRLNRILRKALAGLGFINAGKNRDVFVGDFLQTDTLKKRLVLIRILGNILKDIAEANTEISKKINLQIPSLRKKNNRNFLIEEVALLGEKDLREELIDKFKTSIELLQKYVQGKKDIELQKEEAIKFALSLKTKMKIPENLIREFDSLYELAQKKEIETTVLKLLSWDDEKFAGKLKKFEKALDLVADKDKIVQDFAPQIKSAFKELVEQGETDKDMEKLANFLIRKYSTLQKIEGFAESNAFKTALFKISSYNLDRVRDIQHLYKTNYQISILNRKRRRIKL